MNRLQRRLALALLFSCAIAPAAFSRDWSTVRIGVDPAYRPFAYKAEGGELTGFDVDMARALCDQIKAQCTFVEQNWDGIIPALNAHKFDAIISSMSITEDRKRAVLFTEPYYHSATRIVAKANSGPGTPESLKGKRVGVLKASVQEKYGRQVLEPAGASVVGYDTQDQVYLDLVSGRLDATVADGVESGQGFLKSAAGKPFGFIGPELREPVSIFGEGAGIALRKSDAELRDKFNAAIKAVRANGTYQRIDKKYFDFDIYGR